VIESTSVQGGSVTTANIRRSVPNLIPAFPREPMPSGGAPHGGREANERAAYQDHGGLIAHSCGWDRHALNRDRCGGVFTRFVHCPSTGRSRRGGSRSRDNQNREYHKNPLPTHDG
jgi:hypothetical protein